MKDFFADSPIKSNDTSVNNPMGNNEVSPSNTSINIPLGLDSAIVMGIVDITKESIRCFTDYMKCREHEKTERKRINATLQAVKYQIDAQKEVYLKELEQNFAERNRLYDMAEKAQERALELDDKEMLQLCYNFMLNVYTKPVGKDGIPCISNNQF